MPISGRGWELLVVRLGQHQGPDLVRSYGRYAVYNDGAADESLTGFICECQGPGENDKKANAAFRRRVVAKTYGLSTHATRYASAGYDLKAVTPTLAHPMPAFALAGTEVRTGILVHPAHEGGLFLASIGCLNPTSALTSQQLMDVGDSRARVIALLNSLRRHDPGAFKSKNPVDIHHATIAIEGEPMEFL